MDLRLTRDPCGFAEEGSDGSGGADSSASGPSLYSGVVDACHDVL